MIRPKTFLSRAFAWTAVVVMSSVVALAQDAGAQPATGQRTDGQIEMDVVHALDASKALKKDLITAATIEGEVTLAGTVSSEASAELAESLAAHVPGVIKVHNTLTVGNPQEAQAGDPNASQMDADAQPNETAAAPAPGTNDGPMPVPDQSQTAAAASAPAPYTTPAPAQAPAPAARPQYVPARPPAYAYQAPRGPVTIPAGTLMQLRTSESVSSKNAKEGTPVQFVVISDVNAGGIVAIPRGATVHGVVEEIKKAGQLTGSAELSLRLTSLDLGDKSYDLDSDQFNVKSPGKGGETAEKAFGGALLGAMIGGIAGRGTGAAVGAVAGAGAGTVASAASGGPNAWIPAEALVNFHLQSPLTVQPVSRQEASRLAQGLYPGGPTLYRRSYQPYGAGPYAQPVYYYAYPPIYYRPYYVVGGAYYWR